METLPQELLDEVFQHLKEYEFPVTERWPNLTQSSRQAILDSRFVQRRWYQSFSLRSCFISILEETSFVWTNHQLLTLEAISDWEGAEYFNTLSICGLDLALVEKESYYRWKEGREELDAERPLVEYIVHLMQRFSWVEHVRFYPIHPKCVDATWGPDWKLTRGDRIGHIYKPMYIEEPAWSDLSTESTLQVYSEVIEGLCWSGCWIRNFEVPLMGNRAHYCGLNQTLVWTDLSNLPLTRVSVSIEGSDTSQGFARNRIGYIETLQFLEVAIVKSAYDILWEPGLGPVPELHDLLRRGPDEEDAPNFRQLSLKEFRIMSDYQSSFSVTNILRSLSMFPNLERLGFAHMLMEQGTWSGLLFGLAPLNLARLWLLDPRNLSRYGRLSDNVLQKYEKDPCLAGAARKVRLIDTGSLWTAETHQPLKRDFQYPGFRIFEVEEEGGA